MKLLDCQGKHYREVNAMVEEWWNTGEREIILEGIMDTDILEGLSLATVT